MPGRLSGRELDVARLVSEGHTDKEIAVQLRIAPATVRTCLGRIFLKYGIPNRAAVAAEFVREEDDSVD